MDKSSDKNSLMLAAAVLSKECIIITDIKGEIVEYNKKAFELFCSEDETLYGRNLYELAHVSGFDYLYEFDPREMVKATGEIFPVNVTVSRPDRDHYAFYISDQTEERRKTQNLINEINTISSILNSSSEYSIIALDNDCNIIHFNPAAEKLYNKNREDFEGKNLLELYPDRKFDKIINRVIRTGKHEFIYERTSKKGSRRIISSTVMKMKDSYGNETGFLVFSRDISQIKELEKNLHHAQKMEAIGTLAGGISHDFNNILSAMFGYIQLSINNIENSRKVTGYLEKMQKAGIRAKDLIQQILTFSRHDTPDMVPLDISNVIAEVTGLIRAATPSNVEIETDLEKNTGLINANLTQIHQVLFNLCTNAVHAIGNRKGLIRITLKNFKIADAHGKVKDPAKFIQLKISDNGNGMDAVTQARMFDPYYTTKKAGEGTGMGLATVYGIIENHKGVISVNSQKSIGTDFEILFPQSKYAYAATEKESGEIPMGNEHILLVDDELSIIDSVKELIEELGYEVTAAANPLDALELFRKEPEKFDLLLTDKTMPDMPGDKLAEEVLAIRKIPVVICSGFMDQMFIEKCKETGVTGFMKKPFLLEDMSKMLRDSLSNN